MAVDVMELYDMELYDMDPDIIELNALKSEDEELLNRLKEISCEQHGDEIGPIIEKYKNFLKDHALDLDRGLLKTGQRCLITYAKGLFDYYASCYEVSRDMASADKSIYYRLAKATGLLVLESLQGLQDLHKKNTIFKQLAKKTIAQIQREYDKYNQKMQNFLPQKKFRQNSSINPMVFPVHESSSQNSMGSLELESSSQNSVVSSELESSSQNSLVSLELESSSQTYVKNLHPLKKRIREQYQKMSFFNEETIPGPVSTANNELVAKKPR